MPIRNADGKNGFSHSNDSHLTKNRSVDKLKLPNKVVHQTPRSHIPPQKSMTFTRSIDSPRSECSLQSHRLGKPQQPRRTGLPLALVGLLLVIALAGCDQKRYTPAKWRSISKGENAGLTTLPEIGTLPSGAGTLPSRMGTLPGRMGTLPGRMGTLPGKTGTLPGRGTGEFRRFGEITDWFDPNSPSRSAVGNNVGRAGTTLPSRTGNGITLPK